jgi:DNA-binding transcriptional MerR regulator
VAGSYAIGRLAALSGVPVKTIRFYSDAGVLPPAGRSEAGHRRYDDADLARLQLVRSLRELGVDLPTIRRLLEGRGDLAGVLDAHIATVQSRIRALQRQLVVLRAAAVSPSAATVRRVQALAGLEAAERRRLLERFWQRATSGLPEREGLAGLHAAGVPELPDDPGPEQLDAWIELAELASDPDFQRTTRENATWPAGAARGRLDQAALDRGTRRVVELATAAVAAGLPPDDPQAAEAAAALARGWARALGRRDSPAFRRWLVTQLDAHTDPRAARYWRLVGIVAGSPPDHPLPARAAAMAWAVQAPRHHSR